MRIDLRGLLSVLLAAVLSFAINVLSAGRYSLWMALALVIGAAVVLHVVLEFVFQLIVPFLRPTIEGRWLETIAGPVGAPRYALCMIDLEPGSVHGRFNGRAYNEFGNRTGDFASSTLLLTSTSSFLYEFTGNVYQPQGRSIIVQGAGHVQFDVSVWGRWIKGHGHFFYVAPASERFVIEFERLTPELCRELTGQNQAADPSDIVRAYHARRVQGGGAV